MRVIVALISVLVASAAAHAQPPSALAPAPDIQIVKYSWSKDRIDRDKNPYGSRTQISDMTSRRGSILEERQARETKASREKSNTPPRYAFDYKLTVLNAGPKAIKEIDWDYIFTDATTGEELGRREFTSVEKIGAGKRKDLSVLVTAPQLRESAFTHSAKRSATGLSSALSSAASSTRTELAGRLHPADNVSIVAVIGEHKTASKTCEIL